VLAALAVVRHPDADVTVVSSDTDFYQLLQTHSSLRLYNPVKKEFVTPPEYDYVTWKALRGDASDNIPGFKGIGDKRALTLVNDPAQLKDFLAEPGNQALFDRNISMIKFHDLTADMQSIETHFCDAEIDWTSVRTDFNDMKFFSMTSDKSWNKFVQTFQHLS
jgi:5'-3' exonuclease